MQSSAHTKKRIQPVINSAKPPKKAAVKGSKSQPTKPSQAQASRPKLPDLGLSAQAHVAGQPSNGTYLHVGASASDSETEDDSSIDEERGHDAGRFQATANASESKFLNAREHPQYRTTPDWGQGGNEQNHYVCVGDNTDDDSMSVRTEDSQSVDTELVSNGKIH